MSVGRGDGEQVRQHVRKVLGQLRALRERRQAQRSDKTVEVEREEDISRRVSGDKGPS
jgi:hypothetical protein